MDKTGSSSQDLLGAIRVAALYFLLSLIWIPVSDAVVSRMADTEDRLTDLQTLKGWLWVALTSILLFVLVRHALRRVRQDASLLSEIHAQRELVLRQVPLVISTTDTELNLTSMVGGGLEKAGLSPNEGVGRPLTDLARSQETKEKASAALKKAVGGEDARFVTTYEGRIFDTSLAPLRAASGEITGVVAVSLDVTDLELAERGLRSALDELRAANDSRVRLLRQLVEAEELERDRIAAGLHDDTIQELTSAGMAVDLLISQLNNDAHADLAERARAMIGTASEQLRTLAYELKPKELDREGLAETVRRSLERSAEAVGARPELSVDLARPVPVTVSYMVFRIIREAISNACKHGSPSKVSVSLHDDDQNVWAIIRDDGRGFDPAGRRPEDHFGLRDMEQRAQAAGGRLKIESEPGRGTTIEVCLPFESSGRHGS